MERAFALLGGMRFFPGDEGTRAGLAKTLTLICRTDDQLDRLITKFKLCYAAWEGDFELRACACSMFTPADGFEVASKVYPDGVPSFAELRHPELASIPPAARRLDLPPAEQITAYRQLEAAKLLEAPGVPAAPYTEDPELENLVRECAAAAKVEPRRAHTVEEISAILYKKRE